MNGEVSGSGGRAVVGGGPGLVGTVTDADLRSRCRPAQQKGCQPEDRTEQSPETKTCTKFF